MGQLSSSAATSHFFRCFVCCFGDNHKINAFAWWIYFLFCVVLLFFFFSFFCTLFKIGNEGVCRSRYSWLMQKEYCFLRFLFVTISKLRLSNWIGAMQIGIETKKQSLDMISLLLIYNSRYIIYICSYIIIVGPYWNFSSSNFYFDDDNILRFVVCHGRTRRNHSMVVATVYKYIESFVYRITYIKYIYIHTNQLSFVN